MNGPAAEEALLAHDAAQRAEVARLRGIIRHLLPLAAFCAPPDGMEWVRIAREALEGKTVVSVQEVLAAKDAELTALNAALHGCAMKLTKAEAEVAALRGALEKIGKSVICDHGKTARAALEKP
jgi:hypothetical protein